MLDASEYVFNESDQGLAIPHVPALRLNPEDGAQRFAAMFIAVHRRTVVCQCGGCNSRARFGAGCKGKTTEAFIFSVFARFASGHPLLGHGASNPNEAPTPAPAYPSNQKPELFTRMTN